MNQDTVLRALDNDLSAFDSLIEDHQDRWIRMAMSVIGNKDDALDAFQDGIINIYRSLKSYRQEASFTTWASKVMMNTYLQHRKGMSRRKAREVMESDFTDLDGIADIKYADKEVLDTEKTTALRGAIQRLPRQQQMAVVLKYDGQMTIAEVADSLNCSSGTVKRYLHRAMGKLQKELREYFK
jgi:RNA polymerase sigma-70 factor (ECF subfamily)